jgi:hypothetical protein
MEISDVRRRVRHTLERARRASAERRARVDAAARAYESFLSKVATPVFRMFATAIKAEGHAFVVFTPAGGLRLASERSADDYIELLLDTESDPPGVAARINRGRGSRLLTAERPVRESAAVENLTEEDVLEFLLREIGPFVER